MRHLIEGLFLSEGIVEGKAQWQECGMAGRVACAQQREINAGVQLVFPCL